MPTSQQKTRTVFTYRPLGPVVLPVTPADCREGSEIRVIEAWVEVHLANPRVSLPIDLFQRILLGLSDQERESLSDDERGAVAKFETIAGRELDRIAQRRSKNLERILEGQRPEVIEAYRSADPLHAIIGSVSPDGHFVPGKAKLTPQEARAYELRLRGHSVREIAEFMDRKHASRRTKQLLGDQLAVEDVEAHLKRARRKLRDLFGFVPTSLSAA